MFSMELHLLLYSLTVKLLQYFFIIMPVGLNLNLTYGLKPQVNSVKIVTVYRHPFSKLRVTIPQGQHHVSSGQQS